MNSTLCLPFLAELRIVLTGFQAGAHSTLLALAAVSDGQAAMRARDGEHVDETQ